MRDLRLVCVRNFAIWPRVENEYFFFCLPLLVGQASMQSYYLGLVSYHIKLMNAFNILATSHNFIFSISDCHIESKKKRDKQNYVGKWIGLTAVKWSVSLFFFNRTHTQANQRYEYGMSGVANRSILVDDVFAYTLSFTIHLCPTQSLTYHFGWQ